MLEKYGVVETFVIKTKIEDSQVLSRGIAIVQFQDKSAAADALRKLPFERSLGSFVDVDFYQSKESRMQDLEKNRNPLQ